MIIPHRFSRAALYLACRMFDAAIAIRHRFGGPVGRFVAGLIIDRSETIYNAWYASESAFYLAYRNRAKLEADE